MSDIASYSTGDWYNLDIVVGSDNIICSIDDEEIFNIYDATFSSGQAGLYCWANDNSYWDNFCLRKLFSLAVPQNISIESIGSTITITWDSVDGANSYRVYSSDNPYNNFEIDETGTFDDTSWTVTNVFEKRFYHVTAHSDILD